MNYKIEKVRNLLKDKSRFYIIQNKKFVYIYDSFAHKIRILTKHLYQIITNQSFQCNTRILESEKKYFEKIIDTIISQKEKSISGTKTEQKKFIVNLNTSHRCNLNCSYCYKNKNNRIIATNDHLRKAINFIIHDYAPNANEYVFSYSMTSESSVDIDILKAIKAYYVDFEDYTFKKSDIKDYKELSEKLRIYYPDISVSSEESLIK